MLDPDLRSRTFGECFNHLAALCCLFFVEVETWDDLQFHFFGIVIEVARRLPCNILEAVEFEGRGMNSRTELIVGEYSEEEIEAFTELQRCLWLPPAASSESV